MSEAYRRDEKKREETEAIEVDESAEECPECGTNSEPEARFCEECGYDLLGTKCCPKCGSELPENADICEACGDWVLVGQCRFCYAPLEEDASFCAQCGNPADGIECPECHNISSFDFCKHCDIPLTEQAIETIEELKHSEVLSELMDALGHEHESASTSPEHAELEKMREYARKSSRPGTRRKNLVLFSKGETSELDARVQQSEKEKKDRREREERLAREALERVQQKTFKNNQEARRFSGALRVLLPTVIKRKITAPVGWLCNVYDVLHPDGPQGCVAAHGGGTWIYEELEIEEKGIGEVEI